MMTFGRVQFGIRMLSLSAALLAGGCVSTKYQMAAKDTPPPRPVQIAAESPALKTTVESVIIYNGPGSWKKEAYWDEYVVTFSNRGDTPVTIKQVSIVDGMGVAQTAGDDPWKLEAQSRETLHRFEHNGRKIVLGAGLALGWAMTPGIAYAAGWAGYSAVAVGAAAAFVAIPIWAVTKGVRTLSARSAIRKEFNHRRVPLPLTLATGQAKTGSLFLPITPTPQRLEVTFSTPSDPQTSRTLVLDLTPLGALHEAQSTVTEPKP